jgi:hypothetical protein
LAAWKRKRGMSSRSKKRRRTVAKKKARRRRRRGYSGGRGMERLKVFGAGTLYGYIRSKTNMLQQIPILDAVGRDATNAIGLHFLAKHFRSRWLDRMATAVAGHVGVNLGASGLDVEAAAAMEGGDEISGALDI